MTFEYLATYLNSFAYILPPFRQYGGRYFIYFVVLALGNPFIVLLAETNHINPNYSICMVAWAAFVSIIDKKWIKERALYFIILTLLLYFGVFYLEHTVVRIIIITLNFFILFHFIKEAAKYYGENYSLHSGFFILALYEIGIISKLYLFVSNIKLGVAYFYLTDLFEILIAIFFTFYKVENSPIIRFKKVEK